MTKFVGRQREMEALRHALEQAKAGRGQIVAAMAELGVGKSRLFYEFKPVSQSGCMVLEAFSVEHRKASAYLPVIDLLHGYFVIQAADDCRPQKLQMWIRPHENIPDLRTVEGAVKQRIFAMQHGTLEHLFAEIIIQWGARLAQKYR